MNGKTIGVRDPYHPLSLNCLIIIGLSVKMARVRCKEFALAAAAVGWNVKVASMVFDEDVMLIGCAYAGCESALCASSARLSKGISDPAADVETDDCYFMAQGAIDPAAGGGGTQFGLFLPDGYFFPINEDEAVFIDLFAAAIGDGGHLLVYYVLKRDWKKTSF